MPLNLFYTIVQKSQKMTINSNQGGSCLKFLVLQPSSLCSQTLYHRARPFELSCIMFLPQDFATMKTDQLVATLTFWIKST